MSKYPTGFIPGRSIIKPIFCVRLLIENYREKKNNLALVLIDLEKVYDKVSR